MTKKERLNRIIEHYTEGKPTAFAKFLGVAPSTISSWLSRDTMDYDLIFAKCERLSPVWLLTGKGEMLGTASLPIEPNQKTLPRIPLDASAGALSIISESVRECDCEFLPIIKRFPQYDFTILIKGDSMEPEFHSGDEVACRIIDEASFIQWGRPHILDTTQGIVLKRIFNRQESILCRSDNSLYEDFEIPKEDILHIALVVGIVRTY